MGMNDYNKLTEDLERAELESPNGIAQPKVYEQLLALYLYQNDLCNAKYLWKRIPPDVKTSSPNLTHIWAVAQHMWKKEFPETYKALHGVTWPENVAEIMKQVEEKVRNRAIDLISQAYSSISLDTISSMTGLSPEIAAKGCAERGWHLEADTRMVHPIRPVQEETCNTSSEDQLYKLTNFVSFLEN